MSEEDIRSLEPEALKELLVEGALKASSLKRSKRDYTRGINDLLKKLEHEAEVAMDVLEGKDSELARRIQFEIQGSLENK